MELYFLCPKMRKGFWSSEWAVDQGLQVQRDRDGRKRLRGAVRVSCPLCGGEHAFRPDEPACPMSCAKLNRA